MEKEILNILLKQDQALKEQENFQIYIERSPKNEEIISLIEEYVSINYIRYYSFDFNDDNIMGIQVSIKKDVDGRHYIADIEIINR